jgi:hypothetical protein
MKLTILQAKLPNEQDIYNLANAKWTFKSIGDEPNTQYICKDDSVLFEVRNNDRELLAFLER